MLIIVGFVSRMSQYTRMGNVNIQQNASASIARGWLICYNQLAYIKGGI